MVDDRKRIAKPFVKAMLFQLPEGYVSNNIALIAVLDNIHYL